MDTLLDGLLTELHLKHRGTCRRQNARAATITASSNTFQDRFFSVVVGTMLSLMLLAGFSSSLV